MNIKSILALTAVAGGFLGAGAAQAQSDVSWSVRIGVPLPHAQIVLGSAPVYYRPAAPVIVRSAPIYVTPAPVYRVRDEWRADRRDDRRYDHRHDRRDDRREARRDDRRDDWRDRSDPRGAHAVPTRFDADRDGVPDRFDRHPRDPRRN